MIGVSILCLLLYAASLAWSGVRIVHGDYPLLWFAGDLVSTVCAVMIVQGMLGKNA